MGSWRPSPRQARAEGLKRRFYPPCLREFVDYDYDDTLPPAEKAWLAAFTEEHYRGWRLKAEAQVTSLVHIRAAAAAKERALRRAKAGAGVPELAEEQCSRSVQAAMVAGIHRKRGGR